MPIFDQGYQHWNGTLTGHALRWWAVTRQGLRAQLRNRKTKYLVISAWVPALVLAAFLALWGLFEQKSGLLQPFLFLFQALPEEIRQGPTAFRTTIWTIAFHWFLWIEVGICMLLVLLVGPDLISQDLRFNAMPLYLSRPMRRFDYFAGKLGVIVTFLSTVTVVPVLLAYIIGVAFSLDFGVVPDTWRILVGGVTYGLIVAFVCGVIMLALSSLSRNSRLVATMWALLWIVTGMVAQVLGESLNRDGAQHPWDVVSFTNNLHRVREEMLDTASAHDQLVNMIAKAEQTARMMESAAMMAGQGGFFGGQSGARGPFGIRPRPKEGGLPPPAPPPPDPRSARARRRQIRVLESLVSPYPWVWSAGILTALSVASILVLSTRVKSLDRLR